MKLVVDASVAVKWIFSDRPTEDARDEAVRLLLALRDGIHELLAPPHFQIEVLAVVARVAPERLGPAKSLLRNLAIEVMESDAVLDRSAALAVELDHHLFDTLYHGVALESGATLVTADEVYFAKANRLGNIALLSDVEA